MSEQPQASAGGRVRYWAGWAMSGLVIAFTVLDGTMKVAALPIVMQSAQQLGYPGSAAFARELGVLLLASTLLYAAPRTAVLGAILLTGYLGGAAAAHVRLGNPLFSHVLFGVYFGVLAWAGLYLRDPRIRALIPLRGVA
jgi:hypothetical protein